MASRHGYTDDSTDDDYRRTADVSDDLELLSPDVEPMGDVDETLLDAVQAAVDQEPNAVDEPVLVPAGDDDRDHHRAYLVASFNELPVSGPDGELRGWRPPYQAREDLEAALGEQLPDGLALEAVNNHKTAIYTEAGSR